MREFIGVTDAQRVALMSAVDLLTNCVSECYIKSTLAEYRQPGHRDHRLATGLYNLIQALPAAPVKPPAPRPEGWGEPPAEGSLDAWLDECWDKVLSALPVPHMQGALREHVRLAALDVRNDVAIVRAASDDGSGPDSSVAVLTKYMPFMEAAFGAVAGRMYRVKGLGYSEPLSLGFWHANPTNIPRHPTST